jgi:hypothetical protein
MLRYDWRWCPVCQGDTHHTICKDLIICNAHHDQDEIAELIQQKSREAGDADHKDERPVQLCVSSLQP